MLNNLTPFSRSVFTKFVFKAAGLATEWPTSLPYFSCIPTLKTKCVENHSVWLFKWEANCTHYSKVKLKGHERGPYWKANINLLSSFLGATVFEALLGGTWHVGVFFCLGHILSSIVHNCFKDSILFISSRRKIQYSVNFYGNHSILIDSSCLYWNVPEVLTLT